MSQRRNIDYFRIGIFVLLAIVLIIVAIIVFSGMHFFAKRLYFETYFNESVEGLSVGSPVKYRGIDIGQVKDIRLVASVYPELAATQNAVYGRYIYVLMSINPDFIPDGAAQKISQLLTQEVQDGLRVTLTMQGLTGGAYLSLNFLPPSQRTTLKVTWTPDNYYIPSTASTLSRLSDSVSNILNEVQTINFEKISQTSENTLIQMNDAARKLNALLGDTQNNLAHITENLNELTETLKENPSAILTSTPPTIKVAQ